MKSKAMLVFVVLILLAFMCINVPVSNAQRGDPPPRLSTPAPSPTSILPPPPVASPAAVAPVLPAAPTPIPSPTPAVTYTPIPIPTFSFERILPRFLVPIIRNPAGTGNPFAGERYGDR